MNELLTLAAGQGNVFTTAQATALGVGDADLTSAVKAGLCRHRARGVYAVGPPGDRPEAQHLELCRGMLLLYPDAVLAGHSAAAAHGLALWGVDYAHVLLERPVQRQLRRSGAVIRPRISEAIVETPTGPAVPIAAACVRVSLDCGAVAGVVVTDSGLHRDMVTLDQIDRELAAHSGQWHIQHALAMRSLVDAGSESVGESRTRVVLAAYGFEVETQCVIRDGHRVAGRADMGIKGTKVLIEFDGALKFADDPKALFKEKKREDWLRRLGYIVVRVTWSDLERPGWIVAQVRRALRLAEAA